MVSGNTHSSGLTTPPSIGGLARFEVQDFTATLSCLFPGIPFNVTLEDKHGNVLWVQQSVTLAPQERREIYVDLRLDELQSMSGQIVDEEMEPIPSATVYIGANALPDTDLEHGALTNAQGFFEFQGLRGSWYALEVLKDGYAAKRLDMVGFSDAPLIVSMQPNP
ncbi:MAG: hypothetical protein ACI9EF_000819 [Pseudohongiellaceae bacterium]|jgi:hypothetical protein